MTGIEDYTDKSTLRLCKLIFSAGLLTGLAGVIADSNAMAIYGGVFTATGIAGSGIEYVRAGLDYTIKKNERE